MIILGLCLFETISSIDNAIINAEVLSTMGKRARRWFLFWGILFAVFVVRGFLPWLIVWASAPTLGFLGSFTAAFSSNPKVVEAVKSSAPVLLIGGGLFLIYLFLHWLFLDNKNFSFAFEHFFYKKMVWFYAAASIVLTVLIGFTLNIRPAMAFSASIGATVFFITNAFKHNAEEKEKNLVREHLSDLAKILYLEIIDATFSIDGVLGAFAFTLSVPLIIIGNGLGAFVVRQITVGNIDRIKKYKYLKNGAMYSIFCLGIIMVIDSFGLEIPNWVSPIITFAVVGFFFAKSTLELRNNKVQELL
jgi:hypothetical protein